RRTCAAADTRRAGRARSLRPVRRRPPARADRPAGAARRARARPPAFAVPPPPPPAVRPPAPAEASPASRTAAAGSAAVPRLLVGLTVAHRGPERRARHAGRREVGPGERRLRRCRPVAAPHPPGAQGGGPRRAAPAAAGTAAPWAAPLRPEAACGRAPWRARGGRFAPRQPV